MHRAKGGGSNSFRAHALGPMLDVHIGRGMLTAACASRSATRVALLTVWPESYRVGTLGRPYRNAAGADLYPAGAAWL